MNRLPQDARHVLLLGLSAVDTRVNAIPAHRGTWRDPECYQSTATDGVGPPHPMLAPSELGQDVRQLAGA